MPCRFCRFQHVVCNCCNIPVSRLSLTMGAPSASATFSLYVTKGKSTQVSICSYPIGRQEHSTGRGCVRHDKLTGKIKVKLRFWSSRARTMRVQLRRALHGEHAMPFRHGAHGWRACASRWNGLVDFSRGKGGGGCGVLLGGRKFVLLFFSAFCVGGGGEDIWDGCRGKAEGGITASDVWAILDVFVKTKDPSGVLLLL